MCFKLILRYLNFRIDCYLRLIQKALFLISVILLITNLAAQSNDLRFERISIADGLSNNSVYSIYQDSEGYIWIGTEYGLNRYDGYSFKHFFADPEYPHTISDNFIWDIHEDKFGIIWISTNNGLNKFDRYTFQFSYYFHNPEDSTTLSNSYIRVIYEDRQGDLWFGSINGLNKYDRDNDNFIRYSFGQNFSSGFGKNYILDIFEDSEGVMWIGAADGGLNKFDRKTGFYKHYFFDNPNDSTRFRQGDKFYGHNFFYNKPNHSIKSIAEDKYGNLWLGAWGFGIIKFNKITKSITNYTKISGLNLTSCQDILITKNGKIWFAVDQMLVKYNDDFNSFSCYKHDPNNKSSISNNIAVREIYEDRTGNLWIGNTSGGLNKIRKETRNFFKYNFRPQDTVSLTNRNVSAFYEDHSGLLWIGTYGVGTYGDGLNSYDKKNNIIRTYSVLDEDKKMFSDGVISIIEDCTNTLWFGTPYRGFYRFNRKEKKFTHIYPDIDADNFHAVRGINAMYEDKDNNIWLGTDRGGLLKYDKKSDTIINYTSDENDSFSISSRRVLAIIQTSSGTLWIGTSNGLNKLHKNSDRFTSYIYKADKSANRDKNVIYSLYEDKLGNIWMGTKDGLGKFDIATESLTYFSDKQSYLDTRIYGMLGDDQYNIWLSTGKGLVKFNIISKSTKNYNYAASLQPDAFSHGACFKNKTGKMYFGDTNGFTMFQPDSISDNPFPPQLVITDLQIFNKSILSNKDSIYTNSLLADKSITLSYEQNVFSIHFAALHFAAPEENQYAYTLEGYDNDWYNIGNRRFVTFTGLPAGEYVLKVKAANCDGIWNNDGIAINILIEPPFWATWWFRSILLIAITSVVYLIFRARLENQKKIEKIRIKIANDLHDEIGSNLGSITMLSSMLKRNNLPIEKKQNYLDSIFDTTKKTAESMRDIVWFITPENNAANRITLRMRDFTSKILVNIQYEFSVEENLFTDKLNLNVKRNIYLIFKECLNNVAKHSRAASVKIEMKKENNMLKLVIKDDGIGFNPSEHCTGNGLKGLQLRAAEIGGKLDIISEKGKGTKSIFSLNI